MGTVVDFRGARKPGRPLSKPRFIVTTLADEDGRNLYEEVYCARGEMENRTVGALKSHHHCVCARPALPCAHRAAIPLKPIVKRLGAGAGIWVRQ